MNDIPKPPLAPLEHPISEKPISPEPVLTIPTLDRAMAEATHLLRFAQRNGVPIKADLITRIVAAEELFKAGKLNGDALKDFHHAYHETSCTLSPVTIRSILDCVDEFGVTQRKWVIWGPKVLTARSTSMVRRYRIVTTLVLMLLLATHAYWFVGMRLISNTRAMNVESVAKGTEGTAAPTSPAANLVPGTSGFGLNPNAETNKDSHGANYSRLRSWESFPFWGEQSASVSDDLIAVQKADDRLEILRTMILPLLYGWMGALTYVLRRLGEDIQRRLFRTDSKVQYQLRVLLGALAGLGIGWFFQQPSDTGAPVPEIGETLLLGVTPTALAFLAGYSVEMFFAVMDRLVGAFSGGGGPQKS